MRIWESYDTIWMPTHGKDWLGLELTKVREDLLNISLERGTHGSTLGKTIALDIARQDKEK
jgi:hypothetical protein